MAARFAFAWILIGFFTAGALAAEPDIISESRTELQMSSSIEFNVDSLAIVVTRDHPREFIYTDKGAAHLAGEAVGPDTRSYHGFYIAMHEILDGWSLRLENGAEIGPETSLSATVWPDRIERLHRLPGGQLVTEVITLFDRSNGFRVLYQNVPAGRFELIPRVDMRFLWSTGQPEYRIEWRDGFLLIAREDEIASTQPLDHPPWLAIAVKGAEEFREKGTYHKTIYPKDAARRAMGEAFPYIPGRITGRIPPPVPEADIEIIFAADVTADAAAASARRLRADADRLAQARRDRLTDLIQNARIQTGVEKDDHALAWARISLDNLIMNQRGAGIYAGFYWFTTYWGRDTFIVLPGACITNGDFSTAETVLRSFATFQATDPNNPHEGRLPNFVTVEQVQFAGIDGTWWFVRALDELWRRSGWDDFAREMTPVVLRAVEGALRHAVDEHGFLQHGDGETWMDAGGEAHPYSPRGNRAIEVQALFHRGLLTASRLAARFSDDAELSSRYQHRADQLAANFHQYFTADDHFTDHLNPDGSQDTQIRPNALLAVMASPTLFSDDQRRMITRRAAEYLVKPWGILSLNEEDPAFHPKHLDLANYYYDEAYHNGDIWLWLSGPYVSAGADPRAAFGQTRMLLDEIMDEGAVGTLQEIRDGARASSNDEFGGATSQAWSLSELLRTIADDYMGLSVDLTQDPPHVSVMPNLPDEWPGLSMRTRIGVHDVLVECRRGSDGDADEVTLTFDHLLPEDWKIEMKGGGKMMIKSAKQAPSQEK
ncbi:MAG: hypothetical protein KJ927_04895 [Candidatus Eisenbacteria bacterium]|nr:hypothetical protein [Candidatus Eisenbacteria bacterium]MBU1948025.1 hypothetical protein [Candidatus Eisenbacteria bacterium]